MSIWQSLSQSLLSHSKNKPPNWKRRWEDDNYLLTTTTTTNTNNNNNNKTNNKSFNLFGEEPFLSEQPVYIFDSAYNRFKRESADAIDLCSNASATAANNNSNSNKTNSLKNRITIISENELVQHTLYVLQVRIVTFFICYLYLYMIIINIMQI